MKFTFTKEQIHLLYEGLAPTYMESARTFEDEKMIVENYINTIIMLEKNNPNKKLIPKSTIMMGIKDIKSLLNKFRIESSTSKKLYSQLISMINKLNGADKKALSIYKKWIRSVKKDVSDLKKKLREYKKQQKSKVKKESMSPKQFLITTGLGIVGAIFLLQIISIALTTIWYHIVLYISVLTSRIVHFAYGLIAFPVHAFFAVIWWAIKTLFRVKDRETLKQVFKRLLKKYFATKSTLDQVKDRILQHPGAKPEDTLPMARKK